jgi:D-sedoheptulose 7-phosphate isomerase
MNKEYINQLIQRYPDLEVCKSEIERAASMLIDTVENQGKILVCGNGGSAADAEHIVGELGKSFIKARPLPTSLQERIQNIDPTNGEHISRNLQMGIQAISLNGHPSLTSAFMNDVDPLLTYAQQTVVYGNEGDILWGISTSGNAKNILYATTVAKAKGMKVLGLTGVPGGQLAHSCDVCIKAPQKETYKIQELHLPIYHTLCIILEEYFF